MGIQSILGDNLVSAVLYGSAVQGLHSPDSDLNVMVILKEVSLEQLSSLNKILIRGQKKARIAPVFWTDAELRTSADVFPVEFREIVQNHKVLYGADIIPGLTLHNQNLRHQIEFEMRVNLLKLRGGWMHFEESPRGWTDLLTRVGTAFSILFKQAQQMSGGKLDAALSDPFRQCVLLKKGDIKLDKQELLQLYKDTHKAAESVIGVIDKI